MEEKGVSSIFHRRRETEREKNKGSRTIRKEHKEGQSCVAPFGPARFANANLSILAKK